MKYIYYLSILLLVVIRRVLFFMVYIVIPFRKYLRNRVYNYHLNNNLLLKRLYERNPKLIDSNYILDGGTHSSQQGLIKKKKVSKIEYYFALMFWLFLDDDANQDTYDKGFNKTIIDKEVMTFIPSFIVKRLIKANNKTNMTTLRGNSFDLGDIRATYPLYEFWSVLFWSIRNPAYNFNYKFNQLTNEKLAFKFIIFGRVFGWLEDTDLTYNNKIIKCFSWEFGKKVTK